MKKIASTLLALIIMGLLACTETTPSEVDEQIDRTTIIEPMWDMWYGMIGKWYLFNSPQDWTLDTTFITTQSLYNVVQNNDGTWDTSQVIAIDLYEVDVNVNESDYIFLCNIPDSIETYPNLDSIIVNVPIGTFYRLEEHLFSSLDAVYSQYDHFDSLGNYLETTFEYIADNFSNFVRTEIVTYE